jgi:hypothetical protein
MKMRARSQSRARLSLFSQVGLGIDPEYEAMIKVGAFQRDRQQQDARCAIKERNFIANLHRPGVHARISGAR